MEGNVAGCPWQRTRATSDFGCSASWSSPSASCAGRADPVMQELGDSVAENDPEQAAAVPATKGE
jgi:hypothetical protein